MKEESLKENMYNNQEIGKLGENLATKYLQKSGYTIIDRNFRCKQGEIDIIAKYKQEIIFIEVKTRTNLNYGNPAEAVTQIKQKHIERATEYYIYRNNLYKSFIRIDIIEVYIKKDKYRINHIKQIL